MNIFSETFVQRLGWTLVHSLWQGGFAAAALAIMLSVLRRAPANARYVASCATLVLMVAMLPITFAAIGVADSPKAEIIPVNESSAAVSIDVSHVAPTLDVQPRPAMAWVVMLWGCGVSIISLWHVAGWLWLQRLRSRATTLIAWKEKLEALAARMRMSRPIRIVESLDVPVPGVAGVFRPIILLPLGIISELSPAQIEAILIHELAHIRRHDYLVNLLQTAVETLLFYHPAVWWISLQIRQEREYACDDIAARICGDAARYADALAALEQRRMPGGVPAIAANGGSLVDRVRRLLKLPPIHRTRVRSLAAAALAFACGCAPLVATNKPQPATAAAAQQPATSPTQSEPVTIDQLEVRRAIALYNSGASLTLNTTQPTTGRLNLNVSGPVIDGGMLTITRPPTTQPGVTVYKLVTPPGSSPVTLKAPKLTIVPATPHDFIRVVVGKDDLQYKGTSIDLQRLRAALSDVPQNKRKITVLEVAASPDATFGRFEEMFSQMSALVNELGLAYVSNVGIDRPRAPSTNAAKRAQFEEIHGSREVVQLQVDQRVQAAKQQLSAAAMEIASTEARALGQERYETERALMEASASLGKNHVKVKSLNARLEQINKSIEKLTGETAKPATTSTTQPSNSGL